jgi:hypothetical protein
MWQSTRGCTSSSEQKGQALAEKEQSAMTRARRASLSLNAQVYVCHRVGLNWLARCQLASWQPHEPASRWTPTRTRRTSSLESCTRELKAWGQQVVASCKRTADKGEVSSRTTGRASVRAVARYTTAHPLPSMSGRWRALLCATHVLVGIEKKFAQRHGQRVCRNTVSRSWRCACKNEHTRCIPPIHLRRGDADETRARAGLDHKTTTNTNATHHGRHVDTTAAAAEQPQAPAQAQGARPLPPPPTRANRQHGHDQQQKHQERQHHN